VGLPSEGVAWALSVPGMLPLVRGRKATEKVQLALGARPPQGAPVSVNWRGIAIFRVTDFAVRLSIVNWRADASEPTGNGPYCSAPGTI